MEFFSKVKKYKKFYFLIMIVISLSLITGTYAYLFGTNSINTGITGDMGRVDLELDVNRVLPASDSVDSILLFRFDELASNLNSGCVDEDGEYSLCQLYRINVKNKANSINVNIKGSLAFDNETMPNLSWILLGNTYDANTTYTSSMFGDSFNTASDTHTNFVNDYLLERGNEVTYYILVWLNEIDRIQYDHGSYTGVVRIEDHNGNGVTAEFRS